jgi:hypothetical protein
MEAAVPGITGPPAARRHRRLVPTIADPRRRSGAHYPYTPPSTLGSSIEIYARREVQAKKTKY